MKNCIDKFNALDGTVVTRESLTEIISLAKKQGRNDIATRLSNLLSSDSSKQFAISLNEKAIGELQGNLNGIEFIESDDEGLGEAVSPDEIYQYITDLVIQLIKSDKELAWRKAWKPKLSTPNGTLATNFSSKQPYRGINRIMLNLIIPMALGKNWDNPYFLTFKQIQEHKGKLKKGSSGYRVIYFTNLYSFASPDEKINVRTYNKNKFISELKKSKASILKKVTAEEVANQSMIPILKYYNVFNADDIDGIEWGVKPAEEKSATEQIEVAEAIVMAMPKAPKIYKGDKQAYYIQKTDKVAVPSIDSFFKPQEYYSTLFHELIHSTAHAKRLNDASRDKAAKYGDKEYAKEELVAELGASFLNGEAGILFHTLRNSAAYLKGWRNKLLTFMKEDNRFFFRASSKAQAAADYILDRDKKGIPAYAKMLKATGKVVKDAKAKKTTKKPIKKKTEQLALFGLDGVNKDNPAWFPQYLQFKGKPKQAIKHLLKVKKGDCISALYREDIGYIDIVWGENDSKTNKGFGLKHIYEKHKDDIEKLGFKVEDFIPIVVQFGTHNEKKSKDFKLVFESDYFRFVIQTQKFGRKKNWLLTSFDIRKPLNRKTLGTIKTVHADNLTLETLLLTTRISNSKTTKKINTNNKKIEGLGFVPASTAPSEAKDIFRLAGPIGKFVQDIQPHQALILIKGTKHTSKSQLAMQMAEGFSLTGRKVAYIDYEQGGLESKDTLNSLEWNTSKKGRLNIFVKGYIDKPMEELKNIIEFVDVIVADSVTDLGISADELNYLRKTYPKTIWCFISQVKENGSMYGGNKMAHNPTAIIECHPAKDPKGRYATLEKNRGNDLSICYDIFKKRPFVFADDKKGNSMRKYK